MPPAASYRPGPRGPPPTPPRQALRAAIPRLGGHIPGSPVPPTESVFASGCPAAVPAATHCCTGFPPPGPVPAGLGGPWASRTEALALAVGTMAGAYSPHFGWQELNKDQWARGSVAGAVSWDYGHPRGPSLRSLRSGRGSSTRYGFWTTKITKPVVPCAAMQHPTPLKPGGKPGAQLARMPPVVWGPGCGLGVRAW